MGERRVYYRDMREFLQFLDDRGKLYRFTKPVSKDTEIGPLVALQMRGIPEPERRVLLFDDVRGASGERFDMRVACGLYGASDELAVLGLGCESVTEVRDRWCNALASPMASVMVDDAPVQAVVHTGAAIAERGLDMLPAPVEQPGLSQIIRVGMPVITRDPETGVRNVGAYNAFFRDRDRICAVMGTGTNARQYHWQTAKRRGEALPMAIVIGATPNLMAVAGVRVPYGVDEIELASALAGQPLEMVRCKTIPLEVPAHAEIVIEGLASTETLEPQLAFGEYPGYMRMERNLFPIMKVTAITHRTDPIFTPVQVGYPGMDTKVTYMCSQATFYYRLTRDLRLPVEDVHSFNGGSFVVVSLKKGFGKDAWQVLNGVSTINPTSKFVIAVDYDIDPRDLEKIVWALTWRVRPETDIVIQRGRKAGLDPSFGATGSSEGKLDAGSWNQYFRVQIDATMAGPFAPVALPKKEYMERAREIWEETGLPRPVLNGMWWGYDLGHWNDEEQRLADLLVRGDYRAVGRYAEGLQVSVDEAGG
ncbi:MAG: carboxylase [Chloroflexi bacterium]|nr:carboxylase [Chloroflexota bacterium]